mmetsp:Transcript_31345/g.71566  ORF Transcript_31345/g.71566 Transcript_31345/m.71566 type:complete len:223 (-) Transcript_31345:122-790(-)
MGTICCTDKNETQSRAALDVHQERSQPNLKLNSLLEESSPALSGDVMAQQEYHTTVRDDGQLPPEGGGAEPQEVPPLVETSSTAVQVEEQTKNEKTVEQAEPKAVDTSSSVSTSSKKKRVPGKGASPPELSETFEVVVTKPQASTRLGMDLSHRGTHLQVKKLYTDFAIGKANEDARANGREEVKEGDIIVAINGVKGVDQEMLRTFRDNTVLTLNLYRVAA